MTSNANWESLLPDGISGLLAPVAEWVGEKPEVMLPSYEMRPDGPTLSSVFCIFGDLLCEVRVATLPASEFDFVRLNKYSNLRVKRGTVKVGEGDDVKVFHSASVSILHFGERFTSRLTYIGDAVEEWLGEVRAALGVDRLEL